ncbi:hypothetical protein CRUP_009371 [Coryphaenoides rupestris]|nr:hypothetical protein CRUP_009371 [Coryphaenoides rupestris]
MTRLDEHSVSVDLSLHSAGSNVAANGTSREGGSEEEEEDARRLCRLLDTSASSPATTRGTAGLVLALRVLRSHALSVTTVAVLNLIFAHFLFLVTVPFRVYYYAAGHWYLGADWCKAVSSMIHIHLYMCFVFYVVILVTRLLTFHRRRGEAATADFQRRTHTILASVAVWMVVAVTVPCLVHFCYGNKHGSDDTECFRFGDRIKGVTGLNYTISVSIIAVSLTLVGLQAHVLLLLRRKYGREWRGQQVFWAQLRSLCFAGIMVACFVPYHMFRLHYVTHVEEHQHVNEVFLSITALSCLDMLTFVGRGTCLCC